jgi:uncharacterized DUF497 family protein
MSLEFEWDAKKAEANRARHGIDFEETLTVFRDHSPVFSRMKGTRKMSHERLSLDTQRNSAWWWPVSQFAQQEFE